MGESASIGTLLELGNCAYETLRFLIDREGPALASRNSASSSRTLLKTQENIRVARQTLESVLMYATTQLVMWLMKHEDEHSGDVDVDEQQQQQDTHGHGLGHKADASASALKGRERERRMQRKSLTLADRLRRGMTGEMTMDLKALITRTKPAIAKSAEVLGSTELVDITQVLLNFMDERVVSAQ